MSSRATQCRVMPDATMELAAWCRQVQAAHASPFAAAQQIATRLGAHWIHDRAEIGFWMPDLVEKAIPAERIVLEVFTPLEAINPAVRQQQVAFRRDALPLTREGDYFWAVVAGMLPGTRDRFGSFYWLTYQDARARRHTLPDVLAYSVPFGAFAPAELYDVARMQEQRADREYYAHLAPTAGSDGIVTFAPPLNILQIHTGTASAEGTLAGLTRLFARIAGKIRAGQRLTPAEQNFAGYDAVQLMPVEPTIEYEIGPRFWQRADDGDPTAEMVTVQLIRPDMTNWGYDIVLSASSAVNPALLETLRPDELVDFAATLHTFPGQPIRLIFDVVYGHTDNQALGLLSQYFFRGPNMYGQDVNQQHPVVRALMLEMQRRKVNFGADGVRVDGAQDFKTWDSRTQTVSHDDDYLQAMSAVQQEVNGVRYRPWMIFEDGRPWPREDWPTASTYRAVIERQPDVFQWGPVTFAHNTPCLASFWDDHWWRIEQIARIGDHWISGCANHDTVRRGTQIDPSKPINWRLGATLPEVLDQSYDNPAANLLFYGFLPGVPMDFINATLRVPWGFIRNTDDLYGVKVVAEEATFLDWQVDEEHFRQVGAFPRLKAMGFADLQELRRFMQHLARAVIVSNYDLYTIVSRLRAVEPPLHGPELSVPILKFIARAFMDDVHEFCNVARYAEDSDPVLAGFKLAVRAFRRARPWLMANLRDDDFFGKTVTNETTLFYGWRHAPDGREQVLCVANMEGAPIAVTPNDLPIRNLHRDGWQVAIAAPGVATARVDAPVTLTDSQGLVLVRPAAG